MNDREKAVLWLGCFLKNKEEMILIPKPLVRLMYEVLTLKPAADARPVVHGRWNEERPDFIDGDSIYVCSVCGETWDLEAGTPKENNMNFCPNCGATMEEN